MDIGFVVSLPSDIERFEPVARRLPGSGFLLAPGRWPSRWLDSRQWSLAELRRRRRRPVSAERQFSLLVAGPGVPTRSLSPWAASGARLLRVGAADPRFGDPRLDAAHEIGAATRARGAIGLADDRPLLLLVSADPERQLARFALALAALRTRFEIVVVASEAATLRAHGLPRALQGPGIRTLRESIVWAELLAAADRVVGDDMAALVDAIKLRKPALMLHDTPPSAPQFAAPRDRDLRAVLDLLPVVVEPQDFAAAFADLDGHWLEIDEEPALCRLRHRCLGDSARRMAAALARVHARRGIERVLASLGV